jgi:hypothetical protein
LISKVVSKKIKMFVLFFKDKIIKNLYRYKITLRDLSHLSEEKKLSKFFKVKKM